MGAGASSHRFARAGGSIAASGSRATISAALAEPQRSVSSPTEDALTADTTSRPEEMDLEVGRAEEGTASDGLFDDTLADGWKDGAEDDTMDGLSNTMKTYTRSERARFAMQHA